MPDRRKDLKRSASIVTNSVTGEQNAGREPVVRRMERSEPEKGKRTWLNALSKIGSQLARYPGTLDTAKYCNQRQGNACPYRQIPYEKQTQDETRNQRREIKGVMKKAPKINQLTEDCGFDGQPRNEY